MPQSLAHILLHVVFSTKDRRPFVAQAVRPDLHAYMAATVRGLGCECPRVGGVEGHVHVAVRLSRTLAVASLVEDLKVSSSKWMKTRDADFAWQRGYGAFSVGSKDQDALFTYIDGQEKHHETVSFQEEYRRFLVKAGIAFDERYVWD